MDTAGGGEHTGFDPPALFQLIQRVASDSNFQEFTKMIEEIPRLQQIINARDQLIERRNEDLKTQKADSDTTLRETQRLFNEDQYAANQEIKGLKEETKKLKDTVAQKEKTIKEMKSHVEGAKREIENLKQNLKTERDKYNREVESKKDLNVKISKMGFDYENLENQLEEEKGKTEKLEKTRTSLENEKASLAEANQTLLKTQQDLDDLLEPLRDDDLDNSISQFNLLWQDARRLIESYFRVDLSIQRLHDRSTWSGLRSSEVSEVLKNEEPIPIPQSNSNEAKTMRVAAILATLSRLINRDIFQPTFLLDSNSGLRELLREQAMENSRREAQCRALLLAMFPDEQIGGASERKQEVACKLMSVVDGLVPREKLELFRSDLDRVIQSAFETWKIIQRTKQKLEPDFVPKRHENARWQYFESEGEPAINGEGAEANGDPELHDLRVAIVPRLFLVNESESRPVTAGLMLKKSQCVAAEKEAEAQPSSPTTSRHKFGQHRTSFSGSQPSISNGPTTSGKKPFLGLGISTTSVSSRDGHDGSAARTNSSEDMRKPPKA